jgi:polysaccharide export outer membrane protein
MSRFRKLRWLCAVAAVCALAPAQTQRENPPPGGVKPLEPQAGAPAEGGAAAPVDPKTFVIGAEDVVLIRVWREPELSGPVRVRTDGKISLPLGGEVVAAGKTPEQLSQDITKALGGFVNSPLVIVSVQEVRSKRYSITGEVGRPGIYPLVSPTTVIEAIVQAGGLKEYAKKSKITILRHGKLLKFNYNDVVRGKNLAQNVLLENGDLIVVP